MLQSLISWKKTTVVDGYVRKMYHSMLMDNFDTASVPVIMDEQKFITRHLINTLKVYSLWLATKRKLKFD